MNYQSVINQLKICHQYRFDFEGMMELFYFQRRHMRYYFIRGFPYFYQLGSYRNFINRRIKRV